MIDTHIHLDDLDDVQQQVAEARYAGVERFIAPGTESCRWPDLLATIRAIPEALAAPGVHPLHAGCWQPETAQQLTTLSSHPKVVAIGEIGLDRHVETPMARQEFVLRQQIQIAVSVSLPVLLHNRADPARLQRILQEENAEQVGGIIHAFSGSIETATQFINLGFALGIGGIATYPEARRLPEVIRKAPAEWLVLETDAPDMAPHPHRAETNRAAHLPLVASAVAHLRNWSFAQTVQVTSSNAKRVLHLS